MMFARVWAPLLGAVTAGALLPGCGSEALPSSCSVRSPATSITFAIVLDPGEEPAVRKVLQEFEKRTGTRVRLEDSPRFQPERGVHVQLTKPADIAGQIEEDLENKNPTIHLFAEDNIRLTALVRGNLVQDLSDVPIPSEVRPSLRPLELPEAPGKRYFLPFRANVRVAYANTEAFANAREPVPRTTDELLLAGQRLKEKAGGEPKITLSLAAWEPAAVTISEFIVSYGGDPLNLNDPGSVEAFEFLKQLWDEGLLVQERSLQAKHDSEIENLARGVSALAENWSGTSADLAQKELLERFTVYSGWRGPVRAAHVIGGNLLGVPQGVTGEQREAAVGLACWLMSKEAQQILIEKNAWAPIRSDATPPSDQRETFEAIEEALQSPWYRPNVPYWDAVAKQMYTALSQIFAGEPVLPTLQRAQARIELAKAESG